jgi:hypothetical protein
MTEAPTRRITTRKIGRTSDYTTEVLLDGEVIATTTVVRCTARSQFYGVTMSDGTELEAEFASVRKAALAAGEVAEANAELDA